jgi:hypothetical protein
MKRELAVLLVGLEVDGELQEEENNGEQWLPASLIGDSGPQPVPTRRGVDGGPLVRLNGGRGGRH